MERYTTAKLELVAIREDVITASPTCWFCYDNAVTLITWEGDDYENYTMVNYAIGTLQYEEYCG